MHNMIAIGDSHCECAFKNTTIPYHRFIAASARGLSNKNSRSQTNSKIIDIIHENPDKSVIFFFGKVDMDFIINYKYNENDGINMETFVTETVDKYIGFISTLNITKNVFLCELPVPHIDDNYMREILISEENFRNAKYKLGEDITIDLKEIKIISKEQLYDLTLLFNKCLKNWCEKNNYKFIEINKYFTTKYIPDMYVRKNKLDHHLKEHFYKFFMNSLEDLNC